MARSLTRSRAARPRYTQTLHADARASSFRSGGCRLAACLQKLLWRSRVLVAVAVAEIVTVAVAVAEIVTVVVAVMVAVAVVERGLVHRRDHCHKPSHWHCHEPSH